MSTLALVSITDYLCDITQPDHEYVDGRIMERNVGEISHGDAQGRTYAYIFSNAPMFWPGVEIRVQVQSTRFRIPDVVVVRGGRPSGRIITAPPEIAVEVLSPDDRAIDLQEKIDDYLAFGIPVVWLIDPERQRAWIHTREGSHEPSDRILRNPADDLQVPLTAVFPTSL
jgi:Uma2 family endonuclease